MEKETLSDLSLEDENLPVFTTKQVAKILSVSKDTITRAVRRGELGFTNLGSTRRHLRRFSRSDVNMFVKKKGVPIASPKQQAQNLLKAFEVDYNLDGLTVSKSQPRKGGHNGSKS